VSLKPLTELTPTQINAAAATNIEEDELLALKPRCCIGRKVSARRDQFHSGANHIVAAVADRNMSVLQPPFRLGRSIGFPVSVTDRG